MATLFFEKGWLLFLLVALLQACGHVPGNTTSVTEAVTQSDKELPENFVLPKDIFKKSGSTSTTETNFARINTASKPLIKPLIKKVLLYASPTNERFFLAGGVDTKINLKVWEKFLLKYKIPFQTITTVSELESSVPGVLVLPSAAALSAKEKQAIHNFRMMGGSVLSTWVTGVRDEAGGWQGFDFMDATLGVKVIGDTEKNPEVNFLMVYGDTAIVHSLPAGQRIWLERVKSIYPLRMLGQQAGAKILDWSRINGINQPGHSIVFNETNMPNGIISRAVTLGYSERLWRSADPQSMEAIAHNSLMWLLRLPDVYLGAWPAPYTSALNVIVDVIDVADDIDLKFADTLSKVKAKMTYFVLSSVASKSSETLKKLATEGHEIAYLSDRFEGFKGLTLEQQTQRFEKSFLEMNTAGFKLDKNAGFHAPIESQDATTEKLLADYGFTYFVAFMDKTDTRLPFPYQAQGSTNSDFSLLVLPRTLTPPEDAIENDPDNGLKQFLNELDLSIDSHSLSLIRFPNQSLMESSELDEIASHLNQSTQKIWPVTAFDIVNWWRERQRLQVNLDTKSSKLRLTVDLKGVEPLTRPASIYINLPYINDVVELAPEQMDSNGATISSVDPWRAVVKINQLKPGKYSWDINLKRQLTVN